MSDSKIQHAFCDDILADHDAVALARLLERKELKAAEVVAAAVARVERVVPVLNPIAAERFEQAMGEAEGVSSGFFAGVPTFIKDNTPLTGMTTDHGSAAVRSAPADHSGVYAKQYMAQGFVCLGKSSLPEFGLNATTEHADAEPTRNPWHTDYSCGASSGGSAAMVAAGAVPIAHANDGGGSIRIPAACCGLIGLKPSRGRHVVPESAQMMPIDIISEGVVTRSVRDTATFHAEAEKYYRNPALPPLGLVEGPGERRMRVGVVIDSITGAATDAETRAAVEQTAEMLSRLGHHVETVPIPASDRFSDDFLLYWSALAFAISAGGKRIIDPSFDASRLDGLTKGLSRHFKRTFYRLPAALYRLRRARHESARFFAERDVILSPVLGHTTPLLGYLSPNVEYDELMARLTHYAAFTPLANITGDPSISLPVTHTEQGLPLAVLLSAVHGAERTLLELAYEIEGERPWRRIQDVADGDVDGDGGAESPRGEGGGSK